MKTVMKTVFTAQWCAKLDETRGTDFGMSVHCTLEDAVCACANRNSTIYEERMETRHNWRGTIGKWRRVRQYGVVAGRVHTISV